MKFKKKDRVKVINPEDMCCFGRIGEILYVDEEDCTLPYYVDMGNKELYWFSEGELERIEENGK